ncbi:MAG: electron transfer flavoprotein subunit alpha, partial [Synergistaceae bacterium]|nr:electron transfer flavoprotein subunit alpha [Synergistaceae bacterium]MDD3672958.1 electron transfer flavoprotein subunit alpha [Synergistaceae bacterium]MDD3963803.1 electron transfer flavoprotein subunit alpha [Synergistaceae bacterium]
MKVNKNEVWTLAEVRGKKIHPVSRELLAWGRELADSMDAPLASVLIGCDVSPKAEELFPYGA